MTNPINPTDDTARELARTLIKGARYGAIGVYNPETDHPHVSRIAIGIDEYYQPISLISDLSLHTKALSKNPICSLLLGEPEDKGDPLTHPRISLTCRAHPVPKRELRDTFLKSHPKAKLYIDFADFNFVRFEIISADLNGGFGKAFHMKASDFGT